MERVFSVTGHRDHRIVNFERRKTHKWNPIFAMAFCLETLTSWHRALEAKQRGQFCWVEKAEIRLRVAEVMGTNRKGYQRKTCMGKGSQTSSYMMTADRAQKSWVLGTAGTPLQPQWKDHRIPEICSLNLGKAKPYRCVPYSRVRATT